MELYNRRALTKTDKNMSKSTKWDRKKKRTGTRKQTQTNRRNMQNQEKGGIESKTSKKVTPQQKRRGEERQNKHN